MQLVAQSLNKMHHHIPCHLLRTAKITFLWTLLMSTKVYLHYQCETDHSGNVLYDMN